MGDDIDEYGGLPEAVAVELLRLRLEDSPLQEFGGFFADAHVARFLSDDRRFAKVLAASAIRFAEKLMMFLVWPFAAEQAAAAVWEGRGAEHGGLGAEHGAEHGAEYDDFIRYLRKAGMPSSDSIARLVSRASLLKRRFDAAPRGLPELAAITLRAYYHLRSANWSCQLPGTCTLLEFAAPVRHILNLAARGLAPPAYARVFRVFICSPSIEWGIFYSIDLVVHNLLAFRQQYGLCPSKCSHAVFAAVYGLPGLHAVRVLLGRSLAAGREGLLGRAAAEDVLGRLGRLARGYGGLRALVLAKRARAARRRMAAVLAQLVAMPPGGPFPGGEGYHASAASFARAARV